MCLCSVVRERESEEEDEGVGELKGMPCSVGREEERMAR